MRNSRESVNAGSMADIAFLLLIFFLVTTTIENEKGLPQNLPEKCATEDCSTEILKSNRLAIMINQQNQILVNEGISNLEELQSMVVAFVENPDRAANLSEDPKKAFIAINASRETAYRHYVNVIDAVESAYFEMRNKRAISDYKKPYDALDVAKQEKINKMYPMQIAENRK